jgi:hypothetical protein
MRKVILLVANEIAAAYYGLNLQEQALIKRLKDCVSHIPDKIRSQHSRL